MYVDSLTGLPVVGLYRLGDGKRWRVNETGFRFTEPDEQKAIARFRQLTSTPIETTILGQQVRLTRAELLSLGAHVSEIIAVNERAAFVKFAVELRAAPKRVAELTGIEELGYFRNLRPPTPLPSLDDLTKFWEDNAKCSAEQIRKVTRAFEEFREVTKIADLRDITRDVVLGYEKAISERGESGKQQFHLATGIRRVLRFYAKRKAEDETLVILNNGLAALSTFDFEAPQTDLDPKPISVEDWNKMLAAAGNDENRAMLYLMLNGAFYIGDLASLNWEDIRDGCVITRRAKKGKCIRVAALWQETLDALAKVPKRGERIFYTYAGLPIKVSGLQRRWQQIARRAGLAEERMPPRPLGAGLGVTLIGLEAAGRVGGPVFDANGTGFVEDDWKLIESSGASTSDKVFDWLGVDPPSFVPTLVEEPSTPPSGLSSRRCRGYRQGPENGREANHGGDLLVVRRDVEGGFTKV